MTPREAAAIRRKEIEDARRGILPARLRKPANSAGNWTPPPPQGTAEYRGWAAREALRTIPILRRAKSAHMRKLVFNHVRGLVEAAEGHPGTPSLIEFTTERRR
jgi:hypothetical protein